MAATNAIIDACLEAIGESDITTPVLMTRVKVLALCNAIYIDVMRRVKALASYSYNASDTAHTITAGVGTLPTDYLMMHAVYDGDAGTHDPLVRITEIEDKAGDTDNTTQYMIPDPTTLWIFGKTPTNTVKIYYYKKPAALTDTALSSPTLLDEKFHIGLKGIFEVGVKAEYAKRDNSTYDQLDMLALYEDLLNEIGNYHARGKRDRPTMAIRDMYGGF